MNNKGPTYLELIVTLIIIIVVGLAIYKVSCNEKGQDIPQEVVDELADDLSNLQYKTSQVIIEDTGPLSEEEPATVNLFATVEWLKSIRVGKLDPKLFGDGKSKFYKPIVIVGDFYGSSKEEFLIITKDGNVTMFWIK